MENPLSYSPVFPRLWRHLHNHDVYYLTYLRFSLQVQSSCRVNLLHTYISIYILQTDLFTFPLILTRRICLTIRCFFDR